MAPVWLAAGSTEEAAAVLKRVGAEALAIEPMPMRDAADEERSVVEAVPEAPTLVVRAEPMPRFGFDLERAEVLAAEAMRQAGVERALVWFTRPEGPRVPRVAGARLAEGFQPLEGLEIDGWLAAFPLPGIEAEAALGVGGAG